MVEIERSSPRGVFGYLSPYLGLLQLSDSSARNKETTRTLGGRLEKDVDTRNLTDATLFTRSVLTCNPWSLEVVCGIKKERTPDPHKGEC